MGIVTKHMSYTCFGMEGSKTIWSVFLGPNKDKHPFTDQGNIQLLAWAVSGKCYIEKEDSPILITNARRSGANAHYESA